MTEAEALDEAAKAAGWSDYNIAIYNDGDVESIRAHAATIMENAALKAESERLREALALKDQYFTGIAKLAALGEQ